MTPNFFTVNNNLNINKENKNESTEDLKYFFVIRNTDNVENICFSVLLKNNNKTVINTVWFSAFIGIAKTNFAPGLDEQNSFYIKSSNLGGGSYLYGYTKESFKLPPETTLEILYFEIPKNRLTGEGSLEFYFGSESIKKKTFAASWSNGEIKNKLKEINSENFLNFLVYKNKKTVFENISLFFKKAFKNLKTSLKKFKNWFIKDTNF
jgi:hypothetical protein